MLPFLWTLLLVSYFCVSSFHAFSPAPPFPSNPRCSTRVFTARQEIEVFAGDVLEKSIHDLIDELVQKRAAARWEGDYENADNIRAMINSPDIVPSGFSIIIEDIPRAQGGGSRWSMVCDLKDHVNVDQGRTVLQIAHSALGMAVSSSQTRRCCDDERQELVDEAMARLNAWSSVQQMLENGRSIMECVETRKETVSLWLAVEQELRGRKASDAAFWFAMAGVSDLNLYNHLLQIGLKEARRFGNRPSCRPKDLWAVVDRFAAAGVRPDGRAIRIFTNLLDSKQDAPVTMDEVTSRWQLHTDSCALLVWKFSTRQRKQRDFLSIAARHWQSQSQCSPTSTSILPQNPVYDWRKLYSDPKRPLVIDIGCGMGLSLLGIASMASSDEEWHPWENCNFLGIDLSSLAVGYARGVSKRWNMDDFLHFAVDSAEQALRAVESDYPGLVSRILIQFPTPYRLVPLNTRNEDYQGNTQLPQTAEDGFMASETLLKQIALLLRKSGGTLLLQSNCEDVDLYMANCAIHKAGMVAVPSLDPRWDVPERTTQRTENWLAQHSEPPYRAVGASWWNSPVLPKTCQTETEITCGLNGTPVHRCFLSMPSASSTETQ